MELGNALLHAGRVDEAIAHYLEVVADFGVGTAHSNLGVAHYHQDSFAESVRWFQALEIDPDNAEAAAALAQVDEAQAMQLDRRGVGEVATPWLTFSLRCTYQGCCTRRRVCLCPGSQVCFKSACTNPKALGAVQAHFVNCLSCATIIRISSVRRRCGRSFPPCAAAPSTLPSPPVPTENRSSADAPSPCVARPAASAAG